MSIKLFHAKIGGAGDKIRMKNISLRFFVTSEFVNLVSQILSKGGSIFKPKM
jgi:hypothetical protein